MIPTPEPLAPTPAAVEATVRGRWRERHLQGRPPSPEASAPVCVVHATAAPGHGVADLRGAAVLTAIDVIARYRAMVGVPTEVVEGPGAGRHDAEPATGAHGPWAPHAAAAVPTADTEVRRLLACDGSVRPVTSTDPAYVDSVWWAVAQLWEAGLLREQAIPTRWCTRCDAHAPPRGTDPVRAMVRFPVRTAGPLRTTGASLVVAVDDLAALVEVSAVAASAHTTYVLAQAPGDDFPVVIAHEAVDGVLGAGTVIHRAVAVDELDGVSCRHPLGAAGGAGRDVTVVVAPSRGAVAGGAVPTTGLILAIGDAGSATPDDLTTRVREAVRHDPAGGDPPALDDLRSRGLLLRTFPAQRDATTCAACGEPTASTTQIRWAVTTTRARARLEAEHARITRHGVSAIQAWATGASDWVIAAPQASGVPLPLWRCGVCDLVMAIDGRTGLARVTGLEALATADPDDNAVTGAVIPCGRCEHGAMQRVPLRLDHTFDAATMPFARFGFPAAPDSDTRFAEACQADVVVDGSGDHADATATLATLLWDAGSHDTVLVVGDRAATTTPCDMTALLARHGADAVRWAAVTAADGRTSSCHPDELAASAVDQVITPLRRACAATRAAADAAGLRSPDAVRAPPTALRDPSERALLAELSATVDRVRDRLAASDVTVAARILRDAVGTLTSWCEQRCPLDPDDEAALATLHECCVTLAALLAPYLPFLADEVYEALVRAGDPSAPGSVHLLRYPWAAAPARDDTLRRHARRRADDGLDGDPTPTLRSLAVR